MGAGPDEATGPALSWRQWTPAVTRGSFRTAGAAPLEATGTGGTTASRLWRHFSHTYTGMPAVRSMKPFATTSVPEPQIAQAEYAKASAATIVSRAKWAPEKSSRHPESDLPLHGTIAPRPSGRRSLEGRR